MSMAWAMVAKFYQLCFRFPVQFCGCGHSGARGVALLVQVGITVDVLNVCVVKYGCGPQINLELLCCMKVRGVGDF